MDEDFSLSDAARATLEWISTMLVADFDADDSGIVDHIMPDDDDSLDGERFDTDEY